MTAPADTHSPFLAGDDPDLLALAMGRDKPGLPPLIIGGVDDMQDVPIGETEPLAGQATVPGPVVVKEGSAEKQREERCLPHARPGSEGSSAADLPGHCHLHTLTDLNPNFGDASCRGEQHHAATSNPPATSGLSASPKACNAGMSAGPKQLALDLSCKTHTNHRRSEGGCG